jgi:hypothetical protein
MVDRLGEFLVCGCVGVGDARLSRRRRRREPLVPTGDRPLDHKPDRGERSKGKPAPDHTPRGDRPFHPGFCAIGPEDQRRHPRPCTEPARDRAKLAKNGGDVVYHGSASLPRVFPDQAHAARWATSHPILHRVTTCRAWRTRGALALRQRPHQGRAADEPHRAPDPPRDVVFGPWQCAPPIASLPPPAVMARGMRRRRTRFLRRASPREEKHRRPGRQGPRR